MNNFTKEELQIIADSLLNFISDRPSLKDKSIFLRDKIKVMIDNYDERERVSSKKETIEDLLDLLPAFVDTRENEPFNNYWLEINTSIARNILYVGYIVRYKCDTCSADDIANPLFERILHKTYSHDLGEALREMINFLKEKGLMDKGTLNHDNQ